MIRKLIRKVLTLPASLTKHPKPRVIPLAQHGIRRDQLSKAALRVTTGLQEAGFNAFVVGGAVRDLMLGIAPKDFDVATNATPEQVQRVFRRARIIGRRFRIVHVMMGPETIEVTTFRGGAIGLTNETGRIMADNSFGSQAEDAQRRDFTVNALFYDPKEQAVIDYHHGVRDLRAKKLVMIGSPIQRYQEDPVRILRAVRLAAKLGFEIDAATRQPIRSCAHLLKKEPPARLFDELLKLLMSGHAYDCLQKLHSEGLACGVFPLLDTVLAKNNDDVFLKLSLESTDKRIRADKPISVGFLLATLLWRQVQQYWQQHLADGHKTMQALLLAIDDVEAKQDKDFAIPRRFSATMREIWQLQARFDSRSGQRPYRFLEQPRFRAAYDFLLLRSQTGEVEPALTQWWTAFQHADDVQRAELILQAKHADPQAQPSKKRRRKRTTKPQNPANGTSHD